MKSKISLKTKLPLCDWENIFGLTRACFRNHIKKGRLKTYRKPGDNRRTYFISIENMAKFIVSYPIMFRYYQEVQHTEKYSEILAVINGYLVNHPRIRATKDIANELGISQNCVGQWVKKGYLDLDIPPFLVSQKSYDTLFERYPKALKYKAMKEAEDQARQNYINYLKRGRL